jgi:hypothetical protein
MHSSEEVVLRKKSKEGMRKGKCGVGTVCTAAETERHVNEVK